ncbi:glycosyltransferase [Algibacter luteus]|uniref:Glycosyltransferase involved in cell wall bisynthesis n=1 Tax=Algibacter luteus TaxID=1178825 RepID=A0A1M6CEB4_9FLAO|nr:glycosyltransferase [Algibacter luteus]SHI59369.1 Glycosyltransferase involved in cell wall bisynthesis [Algibacter luteus]
MSKVTVSIFMLTYNQEQYIAQAIDSVLMQKTNFNFQLVIGEDCSTDTTRNICETYADSHPEKVKLLPALDKNIGLINNYIRTLKACDGKYIAICDGDDYWIDDLKLQKQVDFLESNSDCAIVGTNFKRLYSNGELEIIEKERTKASYNFDDLIFENMITSVTVMFKNLQKNESIPEWITKFPYGDWPTYLWTIKNKGNIRFLSDVTAVYRTDIGISAGIRKQHSVTAKVNLNIVKSIAGDSSFSNKKEVVQKSILEHKKALIACYNREKQYFKGIIVFLNTMLTSFKVQSLTKYYLYSLKQSFNKKIV